MAWTIEPVVCGLTFRSMKYAPPKSIYSQVAVLPSSPLRKILEFKEQNSTMEPAYHERPLIVSGRAPMCTSLFHFWISL